MHAVLKRAMRTCRLRGASKNSQTRSLSAVIDWPVARPLFIEPAKYTQTRHAVVSGATGPGNGRRLIPRSSRDQLGRVGER